MPPRKQLELGQLWFFDAAPGLRIPITPAELFLSGSYSGCALIYIFQPTLDLDFIASSGGPEHFLTPPIALGANHFTKGFFTPAGISARCKVPYCPRHVFYSKLGNLYLDTNNEVVSPVPWFTGDYGVFSIEGLCWKVELALGVKLDTDALGEAAIDKIFPIRELKDGAINRRSAVLTINFPPTAQDAEAPPEFDLGLLDEKIGNCLSSAGLGDSDGIGVGTGGAQMVLLIKRGKYPEAQGLIRELLAEAGIVDYSFWAYEPR